MVSHVSAGRRLLPMRLIAAGVLALKAQVAVSQPALNASLYSESSAQARRFPSKTVPQIFAPDSRLFCLAPTLAWSLTTT